MDTMLEGCTRRFRLPSRTALCDHIQSCQGVRWRIERNENLEQLLVNPAECEWLVFSCACKRRFGERKANQSWLVEHSNKKSPLWGLGQQTLDVALYILQCSPISAACATNESLARRMLKYIVLVLSMKNKTMLFNKLKQCASIVL
jgi:hypothetical protein